MPELEELVIPFPEGPEALGVVPLGKNRYCLEGTPMDVEGELKALAKGES
jgi:hypothetical protein